MLPQQQNPLKLWQPPTTQDGSITRMTTVLLFMYAEASNHIRNRFFIHGSFKMLLEFAGIIYSNCYRE
jgi:hypothetical protein